MTKRYIFIILTIFLISILILSCSSKSYKITVYKENKYLKLLGEDTQKLIDKYEVDEIYYAKEIISYTDKSVRFIDKKDKELFISGDKIKIRQTE